MSTILELTDKLKEISMNLDDTIDLEIRKMNEEEETLRNEIGDLLTNYAALTSRRRVLKEVKGILKGRKAHEPLRGPKLSKIYNTALALKRPFTAKDIATIHPEIKGVSSLLSILASKERVFVVGKVKSKTGHACNLYTV